MHKGSECEMELPTNGFSWPALRPCAVENARLAGVQEIASLLKATGRLRILRSEDPIALIPRTGVWVW